MAVKIYDTSLDLVADIAAAYGISYELRANSIPTASFSIPFDEWHADEIVGGYYAEIYDNDERLELFRITKIHEHRTPGDESIRVECEHVLATLLDDEFDDTTSSGPGTATSIGDVLDEQSNWAIGTCDYDEQYLYEWKRGTKLWAALQDIVSRLQDGYLWTYNTEGGTPWTLNLVEQSSSDNPTAYIDYSRNLKDIEKETDRTDLVTRLYPWGEGAGDAQIDVSSVNPTGQTYIDQNTGTYGTIVHHWTDQRYTTAQELYDAAVLYLDMISSPKVTYRLSAAHLAAISGESIDDLTLGAMMRVTDEDLDIEDDVRIVSISKGDVTGAPGDVQLELGNKTPEFDLRTYVQSNDLSGVDIQNIPGGAVGGLPATPTDAGLYISTSYLGYHNGSSWATYMDSSGRLYAEHGTYYFRFNPVAGTLSIKVSAIDISATSNVVDTQQVVDGSITNAKIETLSVSKLTTGTLDAQTITLANAGAIKLGKTAYADNTAGFWLGEGGVNALFNIGDATSFLKWTGSGLLISGSITGTLSADLDLNNNALFNCNTIRGGTDADDHTINLDTDEWKGYSVSPYAAANSSYLLLTQSASLRGHTDLTLDAQAGNLYLDAASDIIIESNIDFSYGYTTSGTAANVYVAVKNQGVSGYKLRLYT